MNPQDPLANLQPLRAPELIGWWPPAPGWWVLMLVLILTLAALTYWLVKRYRKNAYRRHAVKQLQSLAMTFKGDDNVCDHLSQVNALLKSVALVAYSPHEIASQHGESWRKFLNQSAAPGEPFQPSFAEALYQKTPPEIDITQIHRAADHWIRHHRVTP